MRYVMPLLVVMLLGGCGGKLCKPGATAYDFERDKRRCMNEAAKVADAWGAAGNPFMIAEDANKCMQYEYGWSRCEE